MLYVVVGENPERAKTAQKIIEAEIKKGAGGAGGTGGAGGYVKKLISFSDASWQKESALAYSGGADMFGNNYIVHLSRISANQNGLEFFLNEAQLLVESETVYVAEENEITKELKEIFEKVGAQVTEIKKAKENFFGQLNAFSLVDAYNNRDKKNTWIIFNKLIKAGVSAEEIAGALIWNFKNLALYFSAHNSSLSDSAKNKKPTAESLGMKPFVFSKVSASAKNFTQKEISEKSFELSSALHRSHRGEGEGATLLELFILGKSKPLKK